MKRTLCILLLMASCAYGRVGRLNTLSTIEGSTVVNQTITNLTSTTVNVTTVYATTIEATTIQEVTNVYTTNIRASGKATIYVNNPPLYFDQVTASETDWWLAVNGDGEGDNDDWFEGGTGTTAMTNTRWRFSPTGIFSHTAAANPAPTASGEEQWDSDDFWMVRTDGTTDFATAQKMKMFSMTIYDPDTLYAVDAEVPIFPVEAEVFPGGIQLVDVGIKTDASSTYSVVFRSKTAPNDGSPAAIETVATSTSLEAEDDGTITNAAIAAGSIVYITIPSTDIDYLQVWGTYYVKTND